MSSDEEERSLFKKVYKDPIEIQKARLDRLMNNVEKPVFIPQRRDPRAPRAFQPHEYVRNVMGKYSSILFCILICISIIFRC